IFNAGEETFRAKKSMCLEKYNMMLNEQRTVERLSSPVLEFLYNEELMTQTQKRKMEIRLSVWRLLVISSLGFVDSLDYPPVKKLQIQKYAFCKNVIACREIMQMEDMEDEATIP
ncbi:15935_t:CDS:2, partial [Funneliformis caledonium]